MGNTSVLSLGVVTRRLGSCPRPEDWDLGKVDANRTPSHIPQRGEANSDAGRFPMYSHNGNLTSLLHAVTCFGPIGIFRESGPGRILSSNGPYMPNLGPIRVGTRHLNIAGMEFW
jgi:hypothetical protein